MFSTPTVFGSAPVVDGTGRILWMENDSLRCVTSAGACAGWKAATGDKTALPIRPSVVLGGDGSAIFGLFSDGNGTQATMAQFSALDGSIVKKAVWIPYKGKVSAISSLVYDWNTNVIAFTTASETSGWQIVTYCNT